MHWNLIKPETNLTFLQYTEGIFKVIKILLKPKKVTFYAGNLLEI